MLSVLPAIKDCSVPRESEGWFSGKDWSGKSRRWSPAAHKTLGTFPAGAIRFSFGWSNTAEEVDAALRALEKICRGACIPENSVIK